MKSRPLSNWDKKPAIFMHDRLLIDGQQVMMTWETPMMHRMARMLHDQVGGDLLEVGFGMSISATELQRLGVKSHTIIEPHPEVFERAISWKNNYPKASITLINDYWQNVDEKLPQFDGIFFDPFSPTREDAECEHFHFFKIASESLLKHGGAMTFYNMNPRLELSYQDELFKFFSKVDLERVNIFPPLDCDYASVDMVPLSPEHSPSIYDYLYTLCILAVK